MISINNVYCLLKKLFSVWCRPYIAGKAAIPLVVLPVSCDRMFLPPDHLQRCRQLPYQSWGGSLWLQADPHTEHWASLHEWRKGRKRSERICCMAVFEVFTHALLFTLPYTHWQSCHYIHEALHLCGRIGPSHFVHEWLTVNCDGTWNCQETAAEMHITTLVGLE